MNQKPKISLVTLFSNFREAMKEIRNKNESLAKKYLKLQQQLNDKSRIDAVTKNIHESYE